MKTPGTPIQETAFLARAPRPERRSREAEERERVIQALCQDLDGHLPQPAPRRARPRPAQPFPPLHAARPPVLPVTPKPHGKGLF